MSDSWFFATAPENKEEIDPVDPVDARNKFLMLCQIKTSKVRLKCVNREPPPPKYIDPIKYKLLRPDIDKNKDDDETKRLIKELSKKLIECL